MNTPLFIAKRYLFSKKSVHAINIISGISAFGVLVGTAALIIILSAFNGLERMILTMYSTFTPELRIEPATGKFFHIDSVDQKWLKDNPKVLYYAEVLQEKVLLRYGENQFIATLRGSQADLPKTKQADSLIAWGSYDLRRNNEDLAVIGSAVQGYLGINIEDDFSEILVYSPRKGAGSSINPADEFNVRGIKPAGVLRPQQQLDDYLITPLSFAKEVIGEYDRISAIEIDLKEDAVVSTFQKTLSDQLGAGFVVKDRGQQNPTLYKILNSEKWAIFLILTFVLIIAILNIIGSLTMLVIDKQKDVVILQSLGANQSFIKKIFFSEGMFISMVGCIIGMVIGLLFCLLQQHFGFIKMSGMNMVTDVYPIAIKWRDFLVVFLTVFCIATIASFVSSRLSIKNTGEQLS